MSYILKGQGKEQCSQKGGNIQRAGAPVGSFCSCLSLHVLCVFPTCGTAGPSYSGGSGQICTQIFASRGWILPWSAFRTLLTYCL